MAGETLNPGVLWFSSGRGTEEGRGDTVPEKAPLPSCVEQPHLKADSVHATPELLEVESLLNYLELLGAASQDGIKAGDSFSVLLVCWYTFSVTTYFQKTPFP